MRASARIEVARRGGRDVLVDARSEPPLAIRNTADRILLVGSAAAPVGGDALEHRRSSSGRTRSASIGSVAATSIFPGPHGERSHIRTTVAVGGGARLRLVAGAARVDRRLRSSLDDACRARGRRPLHADRGDLARPVRPGVGNARDWICASSATACRSSTTSSGSARASRAPGARSAWADARHVISGVVIGADAGEAVTRVGADGRGAWLPVAADAAMVLVVARRPSRRVAAARPTPPGPANPVHRVSGPGATRPGGQRRAKRRDDRVTNTREDGDRPQHGPGRRTTSWCDRATPRCRRRARALAPIRPSPSPAGARRTTAASRASTRPARRRSTRRSAGTRRTTCPARPVRCPTRGPGTSAAS